MYVREGQDDQKTSPNAGQIFNVEVIFYSFEKIVSWRTTTETVTVAG